MKPKSGGYIAIGIGVVVAIGIFGMQNDGENQIDENTVFHITLASPENYENGVFTDSFQIEEGDYEFDFVPNGDSPKILSISLQGDTFSFSEDFELEGTPHETGISVYYTWDYLGKKNLTIEENQQLRIQIDPHNNLLGPVSIDLIPLK